MQLAKAVNVSETAVSHWVNGDVVPRPKKIDEICRYLNCTVEYLTTDHDKVVELAPEDVLAEEIRKNPRLFRLMFYASSMSDSELDVLIQKALELRK